jgi:hypothetical protein
MNKYPKIETIEQALTLTMKLIEEYANYSDETKDALNRFTTLTDYDRCRDRARLIGAVFLISDMLGMPEDEVIERLDAANAICDAIGKTPETLTHEDLDAMENTLKN